MKRLMVFFSVLFFLTTSGCGSKDITPLPGSAGGAAILIIADKMSELPVWEWEELQRVLRWMQSDLHRTFRNNGFTVTSIDSMKSYSASMGKLLIVDVLFFDGGPGVKRPRGVVGGRVASLETGVKFLDSRGALLSSWQDGADSKKGGTYCAEDINMRLYDKLSIPR